MKSTRTLFSLVFLIGALTVSSCEQKSSPEKPAEVVVVDEDTTDMEIPEVPVDPIPNTPPTVDIAVYTEYPEAIDGCACYFSKTGPELKVGKYIFMTNYEKKAYMMLDGKMRVFDLTSSKDTKDGKLMDTWKSPNYDMVVKTSETGQIDETWQKIGTISIKPKDKEATVISVVGECGC